MVTNKETTVKISSWLIKEVEKFISSNRKNSVEFPSKRNFVDIAVLSLLENKGVKIN